MIVDGLDAMIKKMKTMISIGVIVVTERDNGGAVVV